MSYGFRVSKKAIYTEYGDICDIRDICTLQTFCLLMKQSRLQNNILYNAFKILQVYRFYVNIGYQNSAKPYIEKHIKPFQEWNYLHSPASFCSISWTSHLSCLLKNRMTWCIVTSVSGQYTFGSTLGRSRMRDSSVRKTGKLNVKISEIWDILVREINWCITNIFIYANSICKMSNKTQILHCARHLRKIKRSKM